MLLLHKTLPIRIGLHMWTFKRHITGTHNFFAQTQHAAKKLGLDFVLTTTSHQSYYQTYSQSKFFFGVFTVTTMYYSVPFYLSSEKCICKGNTVF
jgi:hypothetical protein